MKQDLASESEMRAVALTVLSVPALLVAVSCLEPLPAGKPCRDDEACGPSLVCAREEGGAGVCMPPRQKLDGGPDEQTPTSEGEGEGEGEPVACGAGTHDGGGGTCVPLGSCAALFFPCGAACCAVEVEGVDVAASPVSAPSLAFDAAGFEVVSFFDAGSGRVQLARGSPAGFTLEDPTPDSQVTLGAARSTRVSRDAAGELQVSFVDNRHLWLFFRHQGRWMWEVVSGQADVRIGSIVGASTAELRAAYLTVDNNVEVARQGIPWGSRTISFVGQSPSYTDVQVSIAMGSAGEVALVWDAPVRGRLEFTVLDDDIFAPDPSLLSGVLRENQENGGHHAVTFGTAGPAVVWMERRTDENDDPLAPLDNGFFFAPLAQPLAVEVIDPEPFSGGRPQLVIAPDGTAIATAVHLATGVLSLYLRREDGWTKVPIVDGVERAEAQCLTLDEVGLPRVAFINAASGALHLARVLPP